MTAGELRETRFGLLVADSTALPAGIVGAIVFGCSLFGIVTRPIGQLSAFWIANAVLLGLIVRHPRLVTPLGLLSAAAGYVAADLMTGGALIPTLLLTAANICGVIAGYLVLSRCEPQDRRLERPFSIFCVVTASLIASAAAGAIGAMISPLLFGSTVTNGLLFWFVTELVNYVAVLPLILSAPTPSLEKITNFPIWTSPIDLPKIGPIAALVFSCAASVAVGGPGAVAFPVPALLWCALAYGMFATASLTLLFSAWTMLALSLGYLSVPFDNGDWQTVMSIRLGVTLMALAPLTLSSVTKARNDLMLQLRYVASHDQLTSTLNRSAWVERARSLLQGLAEKKQPTALLMLDIDHFKVINDTFGHAAGDRVLAAFADITSRCLDQGDVFGRVGGEEFAILLGDRGAAEIDRLSERIREEFAQATIETGGGSIGASVSIGAVFASIAPEQLEPLLLAADRALYRAKAAGRNRVERCDFVGDTIDLVHPPATSNATAEADLLRPQKFN